MPALSNARSCCGLYFLCACQPEQIDRLTKLVSALGLSGLGGKDQRRVW